MKHRRHRCYYSYLVAIFVVVFISMIFTALDKSGERILVAHTHRSGVGKPLRGSVVEDSHQPAFNSSDTTRTTTSTLEKHWSHATNSIAKLSKAMNDPLITSLEVDVKMGYVSLNSNDVESHTRLPMLAHDGRHGDLSVKKLMDVITLETEGEGRETEVGNGIAPASATIPTSNRRRKRLTKHIKFDFKDFDAVEPVIKYLHDLDIDQNNKMIYLNADILLFNSAGAKADDFLRMCLNLLANRNTTTSENNLSVTFSLGYNTAVRSLFGFREEDLTRMATVIEEYHLMDYSAGFVLPVNARVLSLNMIVFDLFLDEFPTSQLLVWTGHGELPLSVSKWRKIQHHFFYSKEDRQNRIDFDCKVASNAITGTIYDFLTDVQFYLKRLYYRNTSYRSMRED